MYHSSTQRKSLFTSPQQLDAQRRAVNQAFRDAHPQCAQHFFNSEDERQLCRKFERELLRFCNVFEDPPLFTSIKCTAMCYLKRFYLRHSAMQFYPQNVMLLCVYLACKVDEFTICIDKFVAMLEESLQFDTASFILTNEFLLMEALDYSLTVHNSYKPLTGFLTQIIHCLDQVRGEGLRKHAELFIKDAILTDATLLYSPSQIALAALSYSAEQNKTDIAEYLRSLCPDTPTHHKLLNVISDIRKYLHLNHKFQLTGSKLKELEFKYKEINKILCEEDDDSADDARPDDARPDDRQSKRPAKRRKTVDEMETEDISAQL